MTQYKRFYDEGFRNHIGFLSNMKVVDLFDNMPFFADKLSYNAVLGFKDHKEFQWGGKKPFAGEIEVPFIALYCTDLVGTFTHTTAPSPKL